MKAKIRHAGGIMPFVCGGACIVLAFSAAFGGIFGTIIRLLSGAVLLASLIFLMLQVLIPTVVTVSDEFLRVQFALGVQEIRLGDITGLYYKHYKVFTPSDTDADGNVIANFRICLRVDYLSDGQKKSLTLNDKDNGRTKGDTLHEVYEYLGVLTGIEGIED